MGVLLMDKNEQQKKAVFEMVKQRRISLVQASQQCELSYRQKRKRGQAAFNHFKI